MMKLCQCIFLFILFTQCGSKNGDPDKNNLPEVTLEDNLKTKLDNYNRDADFTLMLFSANGCSFEYSVGNSTAQTTYQSASTSKWVTASVILSLVEDGTLSLTDNPQDHIDFWPTTGNLGSIELQHLLSFTSGLVNGPFCINLPNADFESCVQIILDNNQSIATPGTEFFYGSAHMQVVGLMAIKASGLNDWEEVFGAFKTKTGLFSNSNYSLPSVQNPRLAGGMRWTGEDYMEFLDALYYEKILTSELRNIMHSDLISNTTILYSPALVGINQDWHYGLGNWIECNATTYNCTEIARVSSAGAYGAYPFIDFENNYFGIISRQGALGTFDKGYALFAAIEDDLAAWGALGCE